MKEKKHKFTVAITTYNTEKYLSRAINSVLNQKFKDYELFLIDDCSTDSTRQMLKEYKGKNITTYLTRKNTGTAGRARNIAIERSNSEYILFLDGDDSLYDENVLDKLNNMIDNKTYDIIYLGYESVSKDGTSNFRLSNAENSTRIARLLCDESFSVSSKCWNVQFLRNKNLRFKEGMFYEDELFSIKSNVLAQNTTYGNFPIFKYYRNNEGSVMTKPTIKKCSDWYKMLAEVIEIYEITPEEDKKYLLSFIKNENDSIPTRIRVILEALKEKNNIELLPKRNYKYVDFFEK